MKKQILLCLVIALVAAGCKSSYKFSSSTQAPLARTIYYTPTLANLSVGATRATATCTATELKDMKDAQQRQTVVAKALAEANADVLVAPRFTVNKDASGKMESLTVVGYPATFISFRPMTASDPAVAAPEELKQKLATKKMATNTLTVADLEINAKKELKLDAGELFGLNENTAYKFAQDKLLRQEKADMLYQPQYTAAVQNGFLKSTVSSFTFTAFPAKYVNYRPASKADVESLGLSKKPEIYYNLTADVVPVANRIQLKSPNDDANAKEADLKAAIRAAVLAKYNADFILNEQFYVDYQNKIITRITICGTPAVYANFRELKEGDVIDYELVAPSQTASGGAFSFFDLFKKKQ